MYQQWIGISLDKAYEDPIISLCVHVLKYLDRVINLSPSAPMAPLLNLENNLAQINEADLTYRAFTVTIVEIPQQRDPIDCGNFQRVRRSGALNFQMPEKFGENYRY